MLIQFFSNESKTAGMSFVEGVWWKENRIVVPNSADTKQLILEAVHDHPLCGHMGAAKTLKALNSRFYWTYADREVRNYIRHCPSCQLRTTQPVQASWLAGTIGCATICLAYTDTRLHHWPAPHCKWTQCHCCVCGQADHICICSAMHRLVQCYGLGQYVC